MASTKPARSYFCSAGAPARRTRRVGARRPHGNVTTGPKANGSTGEEVVVPIGSPLSAASESASARAGLHRCAPPASWGLEGSRKTASNFSGFSRGKTKKRQKKKRQRPAKGKGARGCLSVRSRAERSGVGGWVGRVEMVRASKVSQQKSPAEFFAENKTIAGFDTPAKSLYTSVRELVENSLDAAERVGVLPDVSVTLEEISLERFQKVSACSHARSSRCHSRTIPGVAAIPRRKRQLAPAGSRWPVRRWPVRRWLLARFAGAIRRGFC